MVCYTLTRHDSLLSKIIVIQEEPGGCASSAVMLPSSLPVTDTCSRLALTQLPFFAWQAYPSYMAFELWHSTVLSCTSTCSAAIKIINFVCKKKKSKIQKYLPCQFRPKNCSDGDIRRLTENRGTQHHLITSAGCTVSEIQLKLIKTEICTY